MTTSSSTKTLRVLGFMTGTSLDAVDMAVIETDGENIISFGPAGEMKLDAETRAIVEDAIEDALDWERDEEEPDSFEDARMAVADAHLAAALRQARKTLVDLIQATPRLRPLARRALHLPQPQVFFDRQTRKDPSVFGHQSNAAPADPVGADPVQPLALEQHLPA